MSDALAAPASRNSPCPCGSGRRYKDCHGALDVPSTASESRSGYRAPGREWEHLEAPAQARFGAQMEEALALQKAGQFDAAARAYAEVIASAPDTHDALHMLSVIELGRGHVDVAERLLAKARSLRPSYAAIEHNWLLVQDALLERWRAEPEQLAERALPILVDLALARDAVARPVRASSARGATPAPAPVHLIGRVHGGDDDDGWLLRRLASLLNPDIAMLWSVDGDGSEKLGPHPVRRIDAGVGDVPRGGTHVFAGIDFDCAGWIERADAARVIVFCQSAAPTRYLEQLRALARDGARPLELAFVSPTIAERFGPGHAIVAPLLDVAAFSRAARPEAVTHDAWQIESSAAWPVGIVGQNQQCVCEPVDADFVKSLGEVAGRLHIYDPGRFRYLLGGSATTRFFERRPDGLVAYLAQLRCFVHRSPVWWQDTVGRELFGAMALGLPVLCPRGSIHAVRIAHGVDGFLFESEKEAAGYLAELRRAPARAAAVGSAARATALALLDEDTQARSYRELILGAAPTSRSAQWAMKVA